MGFEETTDVQAQSIGPLIEGRDLIAQAQTGTGKTAAFGIALVEAAHNGRRGIVLTPTRELAKQVQRELQAIAHGSPVDVVCLIGGASFGDQVRALKRHPGAILVATPGRVCDHLERQTLSLEDMAILVLDEADEMLSMGFQDEVDRIVAAMPEERQSMLFTATLPKSIDKLAKRTLRDPVSIQSGSKGAAPTIEQAYAVVRYTDKADAIARVIEYEAPAATLVFCRTRNRVDDLTSELHHLGAEALHGGMGQGQRDAAMRRLRSGQTSVLVATDVAARGLDVEDIELVIHDEPPGDHETYIHRIGRTGRAGREGNSLLFLTPKRLRDLNRIQRATGKLIKYQIPSDLEIAKARQLRVVETLAAVDISQGAHETFKQALDLGMDAKEIALRALEWLTSVEDEAEEESRSSGGPPAALALKVGKIDNVRAGDILGMLINEGGLARDDIGRIDLLDKMSVAEVPSGEMPRLCEVLAHSQLRGRKVLPREAEDWGFRSDRR